MVKFAVTHIEKIKASPTFVEAIKLDPSFKSLGRNYHWNRFGSLGQVLRRNVCDAQLENIVQDFKSFLSSLPNVSLSLLEEAKMLLLELVSVAWNLGAESCLKNYRWMKISFRKKK